MNYCYTNPFFVPSRVKSVEMENKRFRTLSFGADLLILAVSFIFMAALKAAGMISYLESHYPVFLILAVTWVLISLLNGKIGMGKIINLQSLFYRVMTSNIISTSIVALVMYIFREVGYSRAVVLGTALSATLLELILGAVYISFRKAVIQEPEASQPTEKELVAWAQRSGSNNGSANPAFVELLISNNFIINRLR